MAVFEQSGTIRGRILVGFLVAGLLPLVGALYVYETLNNRSLRQVEFNKIGELGSESVRQIALIMDRAAMELDSVATNPILLSATRSADSKLEEMKRLVHAYQFFNDLTLYDKDGFVLGSTTPNHPGQRDRSRWLAEAIESGARPVTSPYKVTGEDGLFLTVYVPLGTVGSISEVVTARVRFGEVWKLIDGFRLGRRGQLVLLDEFGNTLAGRDKTKILTRFDKDHSLAEWHGDPKGYYEFNGESCLFTVHAISANQTRVGRPWTLLCFEPVHEADAVLTENRFKQGLAGIGGLIIACALGLIVSRHLSRPLERAAATAQAINRGDFEARMPSHGPLEMKRLAQSFNQMIDDLKTYRDDMESKVVSRTESMKKAQDALQAERASLAERVEMRTRELRSANAELARSARMKDEFLAGMSHELRTPLNAVLGLTESLEEGTYGDLNDRQLDTLKIIDESGRHLLSLINDILDVAKVESGEMQLDITEVDLTRLCESSMNLVKQAATKKNLKLETKIDPNASTILADARRLKQILVNLLSNSVKFTSSGSVGLEIVADEENRAITFTVWDTGIGIAEDQIDRLFQPFVQLDSSLARQYEGTGLGLALVYNLTEIHGGCVSAESQLEKGTRITVNMPWRTEEEVAALSDGPLLAKTINQGTILITDDNESELTFLAKSLNRCGYEVHLARDGSAAVEVARQVEPDIILMDVQMPGMDGVEASHRLRGELAFRETPIIGLTALNTPGDIRRIHQAGMTDCVLKPVRVLNLVTILEFHMNKVRSKAALAENAA